MVLCGGLWSSGLMVTQFGKAFRSADSFAFVNMHCGAVTGQLSLFHLAGWQHGAS